MGSIPLFGGTTAIGFLYEPCGSGERGDDCEFRPISWLAAHVTAGLHVEFWYGRAATSFHPRLGLDGNFARLKESKAS